MTYKPPYVTLDFETIENGVGSTETYRRDFRVASCAFSWLAEDGSIKSEFIRGENAVLYHLERVVAQRVPFVAHNAQFEMAVFQCRYPEIADKVAWLADTMRLVQVYDNGGDPLAFETVMSLDEQLEAFDTADEADDGRDKKAKKKKKPKMVALAGLGLVKACRRILQEEDHKEEAHKWLRENVPEAKKGRVGKWLHLLPPDLLERYNIGDTEATLRLYEFITKFFKSINYDWTFDHRLYFATCIRVVNAKIEGVPVDRPALETYRTEVESEIAAMGAAFHERFRDPIKRVERTRILTAVRKLKTLRGRKRFVKRCRTDGAFYADTVAFNVGSNKQLAGLFVGELGLTAKFTTAKGAPSFKSSCLSQWGEGGMMLAARRKRLLVLKQGGALYELSAYDGKWHLDIKTAGTATGRMAGGQHG